MKRFLFGALFLAVVFLTAYAIMSTAPTEPAHVEGTNTFPHITNIVK